MRLPFVFLPMVTLCAHVPPGKVVSPEGACCHLEQRSYGADQATPFGAPAKERANANLHCLLRFDDGITEDASLRVHDPRDVIFDEARREQQPCEACASQLRMRASLELSAPEHGVKLAGDAQLTQIDKDSRLEFLLRQGNLFTDGVLIEGSKYVRIVRVGTDGEHVVARSAGPCLAD